MKLRILVIGASGLVGTALMQEFCQVGETEGTFNQYPTEALIPLDIGDADAVVTLMEKLTPQIILQPASLTNVDYCETHLQQAWRINVQGTRHVAQAAARLKAKHVFFSSDYIFDGTAGPYTEQDPPSPRSVYGQTKLTAEQLIRESVPDHLIIRTTVVYGWEHRGKNFVTRLLQNLQQGHDVRVPDDQIGSPTYVPNLAQAVRELVQEGKRGTYNLTGCQLAHRYDFALAVAHAFGLNGDLIRPVATAQLNQAAPRPLQGGLRIDKALRELKTPLFGYQEGLEAMRKERLG